MFQLINTIIVTPIVNILFLIFHFVGDFGVAIILFTVLVKLITWPILKKNFIQMALMKKIQPELTKIKKECKGNRQLETLRTMELYRKYKIKPFRSIASSLIQIPIFIALFTAVSVMVSPTIKDNVSIRAYHPISQLSNIKDISEKQQEFLKDAEHNQYHFYPKLFNLVDLSARPGFNDLNRIIALIFCIASTLMQYLVVKQSTPKKGKKTLKEIFSEAANGVEADQAEINNIVSSQMSKFMPILFLSVIINFPGALSFYYFISNFVYFFQQKLAMEHTKKLNLADLSDNKYSHVKEAEIIESPKQNKNSDNKTDKHITRISANVKKGRKK